jgi:calcineurin-like phosphoesterase
MGTTIDTTRVVATPQKPEAPTSASVAASHHTSRLRPRELERQAYAADGAHEKKDRTGMNVLFVGDLVGPDAAPWLASRLPELKQEHRIDLVIVNAENIRIDNTPDGVTSGMTTEGIEQLFTAGVDVITSGNHAWDGPDAAALLEHPQVIRPMNVPESWAGKGLLTIEVNGEQVTVVNLCDKDAIPEALPLHTGWMPSPDLGTIIVDMHSGPPAKYGFAFTHDGEVATVLGTHTHEPTARLQTLPNGTGLVVEVGMTGRMGGNGGFDIAPILALYRGESARSVPFGFATGPLVLGAVVVTIEDGKTTNIQRID